MRVLSSFGLVAACVLATPANAQRQFRVESLTNQNCRVVDHNAVTGDDCGGISVSSDRVYYTGNSGTGSYDKSNLGGGRRVTHQYGHFSDISTGQLYTFWDAAGNRPTITSYNHRGGTFSALKRLDADMNPTGDPIALSQAINLPSAYSSSGHVVLSGFGAMAVGLYNGRWMVVDIATGNVSDVGPRGGTRHYPCEAWANWGILERFEDQWHAVFRSYGGNNISRVNMHNGNVEHNYTFANLSDMCSITASPDNDRWYFHHEGGSQFGGSSETMGYCGATFVTNSAPQWSHPEPMTVYAGQMVRANVSVVEPDGDEMQVRVTGLPNGAVWDQVAGKFRWAPGPGDAGEHIIHLRAQEIRRDGQEALVGESDFVINVVALDQAPTFLSTPPMERLAQGDPFEYQLRAVDPEDAGPVTFGLVEGPDSMTLDGDTINWIADLPPGESTNVRVYAEDAGGVRGYQSFAIGVDTHPQAPVAVIVSGEAQRGPGRIELDGRPSYSMGDRPLLYRWRLTSYPEGVQPPPVEAHTSVVAQVLLRERGAYSFELQVNDGELDSEPVTLDIEIINVAPVAVAGEDKTIELIEGNNVELALDGSGSYDANSEDNISCNWAQDEGVEVTIVDAGALYTKFRVFEAGLYAFTLTCSDGELDSEPSTVRFTVEAKASGGNGGGSGSGNGGGSGGGSNPPGACSGLAPSGMLLFGFALLRRRRRRH